LSGKFLRDGMEPMRRWTLRWTFLLWSVLSLAFAAKAGAAISDAKPAWQAEWEETVKAAREEGEVAVYAPADLSYERWLRDVFQKSYPGIKVNYNGGRLSQQVQRIMAERRADKHLTDLVIGGTTIGNFVLKPAGALRPLAPLLTLPEVTATSGWFQGRIWFSDIEEKHQIVWQGTVGAPLSINRELAKAEEFKTLWDMLAPKWKGKILSQDPRTAGRGYSNAVFLYNSKQYGPNFLRRLYGGMDVVLSQNLTQMVDWLGNGKFALGLVTQGVKEAIEVGLPIAQVQPEGDLPLTNGVASVSALHNAPHPNAAKVLLNWMLSRDGQTAFQKLTGENSLRIDLPKKGVVDLSEVPQQSREYIMQNFERYERAAQEPLKKLFDEIIPR
jgi:iron(III) transport system substrate-binding protein